MQRLLLLGRHLLLGLGLLRRHLLLGLGLLGRHLLLGLGLLRRHLLRRFNLWGTSRCYTRLSGRARRRGSGRSRIKERIATCRIDHGCIVHQGVEILVEIKLTWWLVKG